MSDRPRASPPANPDITIDPQWGFRRLDPSPSADSLSAFYESRYRDLLDAGGRAPDLARLMKGGADADRERAWLAATLHSDVIEAAEAATAEGLARRALDVGAGTGDLVRALEHAGWEAQGTEPAVEIAATARASGLDIRPMTATTFVDQWRREASPPFTLITLMNVLEHVPEPADLVTTLLEALSPGGRLVVRVPNDFNPLQDAAMRALGRDAWWVTIPDHVNYFDHATLARMLTGLGLELLDQLGDYPMELFLLGGDDYVGDPSVGAQVHERRRRIELSLPPSCGGRWGAHGRGPASGETP